MKLLQTFLIITFSLSAVWAQGNTDKILEQARNAIADNKYSEANGFYQDGMKAVADANGDEEEYNKIKAEWEKLEAINVLMADGTREYGRANHDEAIAKFNAAYEKMASYQNTIWAYGQAEAKYSAGMVYRSKNNTLRAANYFVEARTLYPKERKYEQALANIRNNHYNEGNKLFRIKDYEGAKREYLQSVKVDPEFSNSFNQLAMIAKRDGDDAAAESYYKSAVNFSPDFYKAWYGLGLLYHDKGDNRNAIKALKECVRVQPDYYKAHYILGKVYESEKNYDQAKKYLIEALKYEKQYARANSLLAQIYNDEKDYNATIELLSSAKGEGVDYKTYYYLAQAYNATQAYDKALTAVNTSLAQKKNWAPSLMEKGDALVGLERPKEAITVFKLAGSKDARYKATADYRINELTKWANK